MRARLQRLATTAILATALLAPPALAAEEGGAPTVRSVEVEGNRFIETGAVLARIETKAGQPLDRRRVSRDVKSLYETGFFSDVRVIGRRAPEGIHLTYAVEENPLVGEVAILGNDEIPDKDLKPTLKLKPGRVFNDVNVATDLTTIRRAYLKKGYYQVNADFRTEERADGRVDVTVRVDEGDITKIKRIRFVGNRAFDDDTLRSEVASRPSDLMAWFTDRDIFERERLGADAQLITQFYQNNGHLDAKVESTLMSLSPDKQWFYLTFSIHEGPRYTVSEVDVQGDLVPGREELLDAISIEAGGTYSLEKLRGSIEKLTDTVGDEGYAFATVTPLFRRDVTARTVAITFDIEKGNEVYIERIDVTGNLKTEDSVVRRELRQAEGERYAASKMKLSRKRLDRTDLFKDVRISTPKGEDSDKVKVKIDVEEKRTGSFSVGAGYSQLEKAFFTGKIEERNFLGKGYTVNFNGEIGGQTQNFNLGLSDPYFMGEEVSASLNAFKTQTKLDEVFTTYTYNNYGGSLNFGIPLSERLTYSIGYEYRETNITDIPADASLLLRSQAGRQTTGTVMQGLTWDTRNRVTAPSSGQYAHLSVGAAGLGGSNRFVEFVATGRSYHHLGDGFVFNPQLRYQMIRPFGGRALPIYRRYSLGGANNVRGFDYYGISIRDPATQEAVGGDTSVNMSLNLYFPIPYMTTAGFRGIAFVDAGTVAGSVGNLHRKLSFATLRSSTGLALEWLSPVGPVSLIWGFPVRKQPDDVERNFEFNLGGSF